MNSYSGSKKQIYVIISIIVLVFLDQRSKVFMHQYFGSSPIITYVVNRQAAWNLPIPINILSYTGIIFIILCIFAYRKKYVITSVFILLMSGALGNLYDRIFLDGVRDFIDIRIIPVFNLADVFITCGGVLFILYEYKRSLGNS